MELFTKNMTRITHARSGATQVGCDTDVMDSLKEC